MAKKNPTPRWPLAIRQYVIDLRAANLTYREMYEEVTDPELEQKVGVSPLDPKVHTFDSFRWRATHLPAEEIAQARTEWKEKIKNLRWATTLSRMQGISGLIDRLMKALKDGEIEEKTDLLSQLRLMIEQMRKEESADADREALASVGSTRILLANPKFVSINPVMLQELFMMLRHEIGGIHQLDFKALSIRELVELRAAVDDAMLHKQPTIPLAECELLENNENDEDDENDG